jgi:hypothetical protein
VTILIIGSVLLGAILGRFFKVPVLAPAFALSLAMVVASSAYFGHSLPRTLLEFVVLITSLQIGYASGLLSRLIPSVSENAGEPRPRLRPHPEPLQPGLCDQEAQRVRGHKRVPRKVTSRLCGGVTAAARPNAARQASMLDGVTGTPARGRRNRPQSPPDEAQNRS